MSNLFAIRCAFYPQRDANSFEAVSHRCQRCKELIKHGIPGMKASMIPTDPRMGQTVERTLIYLIRRGTLICAPFGIAIPFSRQVCV